MAAPMAVSDETEIADLRPDDLRPEGLAVEGPFRLGLRERKRRRLRREIVDVSLGLFERKGYENTRVVDIVEELDISQPTFFRYFPSKAAVLYEAASMALEEPLKRVPLLRANATSAAAYLKQLIRIHADAITQNVGLTRMIVCYGGTDTLKCFICPSSLDPIARAEHQDGKFYEQMRLPLLTEALEDGQRAGELDRDISVDQLRSMLWSMLFAVVIEWASNDVPPFDLHDRMASMVDLFVNGCRSARADT